MLDYKLIEALAMVCRMGGFEKAARELLLTQSAVSQRVRVLEDQLGTPLVIRGTPCRATAMGGRLVAHHTKVAQLEHDLLSELQLDREGDFLPLPIGVNEDSMAFWFTEAIAPLALKRNYALHISVDDQDETHKLLKAGVVLGCVSSRSEPLQGCSIAYLGRMDYLCLATKEFAAKWLPQGLTPEAVKHAPAVVYSTKDRAHERYLTEVVGILRPVYPQHYIPSSHGFLDAIKKGIGYGLVPRFHAEGVLGTGEMVDMYPDAPLPIHLYWHHWDLEAGPIKELTQALVAYARKTFPQH
jgi:LysR family transcriptional regulator (chromosome initiation inhibitor)